MTKRVVTAAITGGIHVPSLSPHFFPYMPETVIEQAVGAAKAGAAVVHIHARDPKDEYHLYEIRADGSGLRQLTFRPPYSGPEPAPLAASNAP